MWRICHIGLFIFCLINAGVQCNEAETEYIGYSVFHVLFCLWCLQYAVENEELTQHLGAAKDAQRQLTAEVRQLTTRWLPHYDYNPIVLLLIALHVVFLYCIFDIIHITTVTVVWFDV